MSDLRSSPITNLKSDVCIIGTGIAGLTAALDCAQNGLTVIVLTKSSIKESSTLYAQGGIAVAMAKDDTTQFHYEDTIAAGAGHCDTKKVKILVEEGPKKVQELISYGANFDRENGDLSYTMEAAHRKRRILHAADATGREIEKTLGRRVAQEKTVHFYPHCAVTQVLRDGTGRCTQVFAESEGRSLHVQAHSVLIATGGCGQVYKHNTNPPGATGDGIALAEEVGATIQNMEFMQFHPTTLYVGDQRPISLFLISEAVRGEGGVLRNRHGDRFMPNYHADAELAPRDIVSRAVFSEMQASGDDHVYLDLSGIKVPIAERFPTIYERCLSANINLNTDWAPVAPAAHYMIGGIQTDEWGLTSVPGLYAAGEVASTGVHGANRLASNSLLEGLVFGARAAEHMTKSLNAVTTHDTVERTIKPKINLNAPYIKQALRQHLWDEVGIIRSESSIDQMRQFLSTQVDAVVSQGQTAADREAISMLCIARQITNAAKARRNSLGAHYRSDSKQPTTVE